MFTKILTAAALTLAMSAAAGAQTSSNTGGVESNGPATGMPTGWDQTLSDAFFSDSQAGTLRSQEEIQASWGKLSGEQQAQVRSDCASMSADAGTDSSTTTGSTTPDAGGTTTGGTTGAMASGSAGAADGNHMAAMSDLCTWVDSQ